MLLCTGTSSTKTNLDNVYPKREPAAASAREPCGELPRLSSTNNVPPLCRDLTLPEHRSQAGKMSRSVSGKDIPPCGSIMNITAAKQETMIFCEATPRTDQ